MKRRMLAGLLMLALLFVFISDSPILADCNNDAVVIYHAPWLHQPWFQEYGSYDPQAKVVSCGAVILTPQVTVYQPTVSVYLKKDQYDVSDSVYIQVWRLGGLVTDHYCQTELILSTQISTTSWETNVWRWVSLFDPDKILWGGELYAIKVGCNDTGSVAWGYNDAAHGGAGGFPCSQFHTCYSGSCVGVNTYTSDHYMGIKVQGCWSPPISVLTEDGYVDPDGYIVMGGLVTQLGIEGEVDAYIDFGFTEDLGDTHLVKTVSTVALPHAYYNWRLSGWSPDTYVYFRARIVESVSGQEAYGDIESAFYPSIIPSIDCQVIVNEAWNITFQTIINSIDSVEAADLVLYYGQNFSCFLSSDNITMFEDVTEAGVYNYNDISYTFDPGETYYYYAEEQTTDSVTIVRSTVRQFTRYDANEPGWRNWLDDWLARIFGLIGMPPISGWWLLAVAAFLIVFFLASRAGNWRVGLTWGLISCFVLLYVLVQFHLVDPWLVVLLSIVAAYAIYRLVFSPAANRKD